MKRVREIKFRGKSKITGEWVYGYLVKQFGVYKIYDDSKEDFGDWIHEVDPETIGQYIGLKDKNGREIYSGDIIYCKKYQCIGKIACNEEMASFYFYILYEDGGYSEEKIYDYLDEMEVIGNIFENQELLEVAE